jgi:Zn-dependent peptidase ImmA (M78 family)
MQSESVRATARRTLFKLYEHSVAELGRKPTDSEFFPIDVAALVGQLGWKLCSLPDLIEEGEPLSGRCNHSQQVIYVDQDDPSGRWRFTVGHELGHILLKHPCGIAFREDPHAVARPTTMGLATPAATARERDADLFSVELLMPERTVRREFASRFGTTALWVGSTAAGLILQVTHNRAYDAAAELVKIRYPTGAPRNLSDFFGVSPSAMRRRLLELSLVY